MDKLDELKEIIEKMVKYRDSFDPADKEPKTDEEIKKFFQGFAYVPSKEDEKLKKFSVMNADTSWIVECHSIDVCEELLMCIKDGKNIAEFYDCKGWIELT